MDFDNHRFLLPAYANAIREVEAIQNTLNLCLDELHNRIEMYNHQMQELMQLSANPNFNFDAIEFGGINATNLRARVYALSSLANDLDRRLEGINRLMAIHYPNLISCPILSVNGVVAARILMDLHQNYNWDGVVFLEEVPEDEIDEVHEILQNFVGLPPL